MPRNQLGAIKGRHQSIPLKGELRQPIHASIHPALDEMMRGDAETSGVTIGWIINDALAQYYGSPELASTTLYWQRHQQPLPPSALQTRRK